MTAQRASECVVDECGVGGNLSRVRRGVAGTRAVARKNRERGCGPIFTQHARRKYCLRGSDLKEMNSVCRGWRGCASSGLEHARSVAKERLDIEGSPYN